MKPNLESTSPILCVIFLVATAPLLHAAGPSSPAAGSLANSASSVASGATSNPSSDLSGATPGNVDPSALVMIKNRARVFGNETSAAGVRYFAVSDSDLRGKTPAEIQALLSPQPVRSSDGVRTIDIVVELRHPLTLYSDGSEPNIGTAVVQSSSARPIEVHSYIFGADLTVIEKKP